MDSKGLVATRLAACRIQGLCLRGRARPAGACDPRWLLIRAAVLQVAALLLASPALAEPGDSADPTAIVRKMVATYQAAKSIQEVSTVTFVVNNQLRIAQSYRLKFEQPNKFVI